MPPINRSYIIAGAIAIGAAVWVASGSFISNGEDSDPSAASVPISQGKANPDTELAIAVRARVLTAQNRVSDVIVRGRTESLRRVDLKAEIDGRIDELPVEKGAQVAAGDLICRLALEDLPARREEARALLRQHELEHKAAKALSSKGYRAETQLAAAAARLVGSRASLARIKTQIKYTGIRAPFDGVLDGRPAEIGDYLQKGDICGTVVDQDPFLVVGQLSEQDVGLVTLDILGTAQLITGRTVFGKVRFISGTADPRTRTFRLELEVANPGHELRDGITAEIRLPVKRITAHHLSPALLTLDDTGRVGVRIVNQSGAAEFKPVTVEGDDGDGVWVTGLPQTVTVITVGQDFVTDGRTLTVTLEDDSATLLGEDHNQPPDNAVVETGAPLPGDPS
jgi:membrane fusion protein, multidrug efflux system